ncbi:MAG: endonuclease/exonuclease/phosphatase family protein, partial [Flavobacteriales bacterium]
RVYHAHLASIRFEPEDYSTIEKKITLNGAKNIAKRLQTAFLKREAQVDKVRASMDQCPHPYILMGDFNDPPTSYTYGTLSEGMNDAFLDCSWGIGSTYRGKFPSFRIDYIFGSPEVEFSSFEVHQKPYSDHFPISAEFELVSP